MRINCARVRQLASKPSNADGGLYLYIVIEAGYAAGMLLLDCSEAAGRDRRKGVD
jgi:hypothetical protein